jgi:hypothetical protein
MNLERYSPVNRTERMVIGLVSEPQRDNFKNELEKSLDVAYVSSLHEVSAIMLRVATNTYLEKFVN